MRTHKYKGTPWSLGKANIRYPHGFTEGYHSKKRRARSVSYARRSLGMNGTRTNLSLHCWDACLGNKKNAQGGREGVIMARSRPRTMEVIRVAPYTDSRREKRGPLHTRTPSSQGCWIYLTFETTAVRLGPSLFSQIFVEDFPPLQKLGRMGFWIGGNVSGVRFLDQSHLLFAFYLSDFVSHSCGGPHLGGYKYAWE